MVDGRNNLSQSVEADVRHHLGKKVFNTTVPRNVRVSEAPSHGLPIMLYDATSAGAKAYVEFSREFLDRLGLRVQTEERRAKWNRRARQMLKAMETETTAIKGFVGLVDGARVKAPTNVERGENRANNAAWTFVGGRELRNMLACSPAATLPTRRNVKERKSWHVKAWVRDWAPYWAVSRRMSRLSTVLVRRLLM